MNENRNDTKVFVIPGGIQVICSHKHNIVLMRNPEDQEFKMVKSAEECSCEEAEAAEKVLEEFLKNRKELEFKNKIDIAFIKENNIHKKYMPLKIGLNGIPNLYKEEVIADIPLMSLEEIEDNLKNKPHLCGNYGLIKKELDKDSQEGTVKNNVMVNWPTSEQK